MKEDDHLTPAPVTVSECLPIYDEIEVACSPPLEDSHPNSVETSVRLRDGENSMEEDDIPSLNDHNSLMEDIKMDNNPPDDGSRMQVD